MAPAWNFQNTSLSLNLPLVRFKNLNVITLFAKGTFVASQKSGGDPPSLASAASAASGSAASAATAPKAPPSFPAFDESVALPHPTSDGKRAIDLGGLHTPVSASVSLDSLGLIRGKDYDLELFNAERHSVGSNFRIDTNLAFTNCGTVPPDPK